MGRQRIGSGAGRRVDREEGLLLAEAITCLSLVATLARQLTGAYSKLRLWQQVHKHMLPLLVRCLGELARMVAPGRGQAAATKARSAGPPEHQADQGPRLECPGPEEVAVIVLVCEVRPLRHHAPVCLLCKLLRCFQSCSAAVRMCIIHISARPEQPTTQLYYHARVRNMVVPYVPYSGVHLYKSVHVQRSIVAVLQVLDFYVQERPGNADLVVALKGTGVLASLSVLFSAAGALQGAESLRSAALCCAASSPELHSWMLAVPGVAKTLAGIEFSDQSARGRTGEDCEGAPEMC